MRQFVPGWKMTLVVMVFLPAVIALGVWQIERGAQKRAMEMDYLEQLTALPAAPGVKTLEQRFKRIRLQGHFADEVFLVDNQVLDGVTGYWVVQAFDDDSDQRFLVNRGFVAAPALREELPTVDAPRERVRLVGTVWPDTGLIPVLDDDVWSAAWPKRVQRLDVARMSALVSAEPVEIRLEPGQPGVTHAAPFAQVLSDARHRGYAATWFGLALALSVGYIVFGFRQGRETGPGTRQRT